MLTPDNKTKIVFGLSRQCEPKLVWTIHFVLLEIDGANITERVKVDVVVGDDKITRAEAVAAAQQGVPATDPQLEAAKLDLLQTRVTDRASELAPGTTTDAELESLCRGCYDSAVGSDGRRLRHRSEPALHAYRARIPGAEISGPHGENRDAVRVAAL